MKHLFGYDLPPGGGPGTPSSRELEAEARSVKGEHAKVEVQTRTSTSLANFIRLSHTIGSG